MKSKSSKILIWVWSIALVISFIGIILVMNVFSALNQSSSYQVSFSTEEKPFAGGDGTIDNPYLIATPKQLDNVRYFFYQRDENGNVDLDSPNYFLQIANINFALEDFNGSNEGNFDPIGTEENPFPGTYEGAQYSISNINISSANQDVGLFGVISESAEIYRVALLKSTIVSSGSGDVGAIAGTNNGLIEQSFSSSTISSTTSGFIGGLVGTNNGIVKNSYNSGNISGTKTGGLVGFNAGTLQGGYNSGNLGSQKGGIIHTYSSGNVTKLAFLSSNASSAIYSGGENIDKSYIISVNSEQLSGKEDVNILGIDKNILYLINSQDTEEISSYFLANSSYSYPQIWSNAYDTSYNLKGDGSSSNPYFITSPQLFSGIGRTITLSPLFEISMGLFDNYIQPFDIDFTGIDTNYSSSGNFDGIGYNEQTGAIQAFEGSYVGQSSVGNKVVIEGIDFTTSHSTIGLFKMIGSTGLVKNIETKNFNFNISTPGPFTLGMIAGTSTGVISNCINLVNFSMNINQSQYQGSPCLIGSIAGTNGGTISLCANLGDIDVVYPQTVTGVATTYIGMTTFLSGTIEKSYNAGYIRGGQVGGLAVITYENSHIIDSFNMGDIVATLANGDKTWSSGLVAAASTGSFISNSYNVGKCDYAISLSNFATCSNVYYLNGMSKTAQEGTAIVTGLNANQFAGQTPVSGNQYILDVLGTSVWEFDRTYLGIDGQAYQFAHIKNNKCEKRLTYAMKVNSDGFHVIEDINMFEAIARTYNGISYPNDGWFVLMTDIDYNGRAFNPIDFYGIFDGNGRIISNINYSSGSYTDLGLFLALRSSANIYNFVLSNSQFYNTNGSGNCGAVAGLVNLGATIRDVRALNCHVEGKNNVGGFVGYTTNIDAPNGGIIENCSVVNGTARCNGNDAGTPNGGFIGWMNGGHINACYVANDNISGGESNVLTWGWTHVGGFVGETGSNALIENSFAYGSIWVERTVWTVSVDMDTNGGFVGYNPSSSVVIKNSYSYVVITLNKDWGVTSSKRRGFGRGASTSWINNYCLSGQSDNSAGATELSSSQMKQQSSFSGFDFSNVWKMSDSSTIPYGCPIPISADIDFASSTGIDLYSDGNTIVQIWQGSTMVDQVSTDDTGHIYVSSLPFGEYQIYIHRNGQELSTSQNLSSYLERNIEKIDISLNENNTQVQIHGQTWFASGMGTEQLPYIITNIDEFLNIEKFSGLGEDVYYQLNNDINFADQILSSGITDFRGNLNGNNHIISNFEISANSGNVGLFNEIKNATISNLGVSNFVITNFDNSTNFTGGLVGQAYNSNIISCFTEFGQINVNANAGSLVGKLSSGQIKFSYATNNLTSLITENTSYTSNLGGFIGEAVGNSIINESYSDGNVVGSNRLGGFIATATSVTINDCYSRVKVISNYSSISNAQIGGFAGYIASASTISNSFMYGTISLTTKSLQAGLFAGKNESNNISNSYYWVDGYLNGIYENSGNANVEGLSTTQFNQASSFNDYDFLNIWGMPSLDSTITGAPILRNVINPFSINESILGSGTELDPYVIFDEKTLLQVMDFANSYSGNGKVYFKLQKNIDLSNSTWQGLGSVNNPFSGVFDGNNKTISGIKTSATISGSYGLFNYLNDATIKNLNIDAFTISTSSNINIGMLAGESINSNFENIDITNGSIGSAGNTGVMVGLMTNGYASNITIMDTYILGSNAGAIGQSENCSLVGINTSGLNVNGNTNAGGIVGFMNGGNLISSNAQNNSSSGINVGGIAGQVSNGTIKNTTVKDLALTSASYFGGVVAVAQNSDISGNNIYITLNITCQTSAGGVVGKASASSINSNMINNYWSTVTPSISAINIGGVAGEIENMVSVKENKLTKLTLTVTQQSGFVGQIYGKITGNCNVTNNMYGSDLNINNSVSATFNNLTGAIYNEWFLDDNGDPTYYSWTLVS